MGAADAYIRQGIYELASEILQTGFDQTKDEQIQSRIDEIESGYVFDSSGGLRMETILVKTGRGWDIMYIPTIRTEAERKLSPTTRMETKRDAVKTLTMNREGPFRNAIRKMMERSALQDIPIMKMR